MDMLEFPFEAQMIMRKRKKIKKELLGKNKFIEKNIAILGGSTTSDVREILELFLLNHGIKPVFYESEYAQYWQDAMFDNEALKKLHPDIIYIHTSIRNITDFPEPSDSESEINRKIECQYEHFRVMWEKLARTYNCPIIQNNFEYPFFRLMGNQDASNIHGRVYFINRLNMKFYEYAQTTINFYINDINYQSADYGLSKWSDPFFWHMYKYCCCLDAIPYLTFNIANIIKSLFGKNKKAVAVDLDNTLWGGIVGDDGIEQLEIGQETPVGQAYAAFQEYLRQLQKQGILLNVISKNDEENALAGMAHPQMLLKKDDFIAIKANWEPKSANLLQMAAELALLPESFVFVDDNPAEREIVRQQVNGAGIPQLDQVEHYIYAIDRAGYFEATMLSADDLKRNIMYKENMKRVQLQQSFVNYTEYLLSLDMKAEIRPFERMYMSRIAQLTNKSNQFNLTTKRYTQEELEAAAADQDKYITLYGRLEDCFGDNGIVSIVIGEIKENSLDMILWLMSCRVLRRDMEYAMMDELAGICQRKGITGIRGYYYPTSKNRMVKDFYGRQGFDLVSEDEDGNTVWRTDIDEKYVKKNNVIKVNGGDKNEQK